MCNRDHILTHKAAEHYAEALYDTTKGSKGYLELLLALLVRQLGGLPVLGLRGLAALLLLGGGVLPDGLIHLQR